MAKKATGKKRDNKQLALIIAAAVIGGAAIAVAAFGGDQSGRTETQVVESGQSAVIPVEEVTETASFYPIEVEGVEMELLAIRDSEGEIRTAFNTCQSCYRSGKGYYEAEGEMLRCQNCGFTFSAEQVEIEGAGGCNPYPIFEENKTVTDDEIQIGYDFLKDSVSIFDNWKK